jgi:hypothetical protein
MENGRLLNSLTVHYKTFLLVPDIILITFPWIQNTFLVTAHFLQQTWKNGGKKQEFILGFLFSVAFINVGQAI